MSSCHQLNVTESFEVSKFRGVWYEVFAYPDSITKGGKCVMSSYAFGADGKVTILKRFVDHRGLQTRLSGMGVNPIPGILAVSFFAMRKRSFKSFTSFQLALSAEASSLYYILSVDYEHFAVVASCNSLTGTVSGLNVWLLSRAVTLEPKYVARALLTLSDNEISANVLEKTVQNCDFDSVV